jgi:hypothetical protein
MHEQEVKKTDDFEAGRSDFVQNFKSDLNNFLYQHVPGKLTMDEFETLTCDVHERVWTEWKKFV